MVASLAFFNELHGENNNQQAYNNFYWTLTNKMSDFIGTTVF